MSPRRRLREVGGTPIEEAPPWALAILVVVLALVFFPALVGLVEALGADTRGRRLGIVVGAAALALFLVAGLARQRRWRRAPSSAAPDPRPLFVRFSTWLWVTLLFPNVLHGLLVLTRAADEPRLDPRAAWLVGCVVSAVQGGWSLFERRRRGVHQAEMSPLSKPSANSGAAGRKAEKPLRR